jgi:hypothetical protein
VPLDLLVVASRTPKAMFSRTLAEKRKRDPGR